MIPGGELSIVPGRDKILLEGCGCFLLFQGAGKVGRAFLLNRPGQYYYNLDIIGSIFKQVRTSDRSDLRFRFLRVSTIKKCPRMLRSEHRELRKDQLGFIGVVKDLV